MPCVGQDFANYHFLATGASTRRTMSDRLSETVNVKDWGAIGDGSHDDAPNIQAAIDYCLGTVGGTKQAGGTVYFPNGRYHLGTGTGLNVGSDTDPNVKVDLVGDGPGQGGFGATIIYLPNTTGFIFSKGSRTYDAIRHISGFSLIAQVGASLIKVTGKNFSIRHIDMVPGNIGIDSSQADTGTIGEISCAQSMVNPTGPGHLNPWTTVVGIYVGKNVTVMNCRLGILGTAFSVCGDGAVLLCPTAENCGIHTRMGWGPSGEVPVHGCTVISPQTEACVIALDCYNVHSSFFGSLWLTASATQIPAGFGNVSWPIQSKVSYNSGTGIVRVRSDNHHIADNVPPVADGTRAIALNSFPTVPSAWRPSFFTWVTVVDANNFEYYVGSDPGTLPGGSGWTHVVQDTIRLRIVTECVFLGSNAAAAAYSSLDLDAPGVDGSGNPVSECQHRNNVFMGWQSPFGIALPRPSRRYMLSAWRFQRVGNNPSLDSTWGIRPEFVFQPGGQLTFADLPGNFTPTGLVADPSGQTYFSDGPFEGQEFDIKDGRLFGGGTANIGDQVEGTGSQHIKVRYDGSVYRRGG